MRIAADTHVHLYPFYAPHTWLDAGYRNLRRAAPEADLHALCMTEGAGFAAFQALARGDLKPAVWSIERTADPAALEARTADGRRLLLMAGRQIVTRERLEVLALGSDLDLADGGGVADTLARVRERGAMPVLPWALGKWWGPRGRIVRELIASAQPNDFAVSDTYLRPAVCPTRGPLRQAARRGLRVLAGTDPLPRKGDEEVTGLLGVEVEGAWDAERPAASLVALLRDPSISLRIIGRRGSLAESFTRLW